MGLGLQIQETALLTRAGQVMTALHIWDSREMLGSLIFWFNCSRALRLLYNLSFTSVILSIGKHFWVPSQASLCSTCTSTMCSGSPRSFRKRWSMSTRASSVWPGAMTSPSCAGMRGPWLWLLSSTIAFRGCKRVTSASTGQPQRRCSGGAFEKGAHNPKHRVQTWKTDAKYASESAP